MSAIKQIRQIIAEAKAVGWTVIPTNGGHYQFRHPSGAFKNIRGDLKRELRKRGIT